MKKIKMPTAYTTLFIIIIAVAVLTFVIPSGQYDYVDPNATPKVPIAGTYHRVDPNPQGIFDIILAPIEGFYDAVDISLFIIVIGGFLGIVMKTGSLDSAISIIVKKLKGKEMWMIPILIIFFALGGTSYGMAEECLAFYPLLLPVFISAGYDSLTAVSVILLGAGVGIIGSTVNPFATGIASRFAGISLGNGIFLRIIILSVCTLITIVFVMRYGEKVKKNPESSLVSYMQEENKKHFLHKEGKLSDVPKFTKKNKLILFLFVLTFTIMIFGVIPFEEMGITFIPTLGWWFGELTALFLVGSIVIGVIYGMDEETLISEFLKGGSDFLGVALIIGISRGIAIIMNSGYITDTVLSFGESALSGMGSISFTILTYLFYIPLSFLIPSTTGLATLSIPIISPLSDFAGVPRDIIVTAYQCAIGLVNLVTPTSAVVMGALAIGRIPYDKWFKHIWKFLIILLIVIVACLGIATFLSVNA